MKANTFQRPFKIQSEDKHCNFFYKRELKCINFIVNLEKPGIKHVKVALKGRLANLKAIDYGLELLSDREYPIYVLSKRFF